MSGVTSFADEARDKKFPVPSDEAQKTALVLVREVFEAQSNKATTPEQKTAVAKQMIQSAAESGNDLATRFVLLRVARDIAVTAGNAQLVVEAVDRMSVYYKIDAIEMKAQRLMRAAKAVLQLDERKAFIATTRKVLDEAVTSERFDLAAPFADAMLAVARKTGDTDLVRDIVARGREIESLVKAFEPIQSALETLKSNPLDPEANLTVGRHRCFARGDWRGGLPYLALSSDGGLKRVAELELTEPTVAEVQVKLGDAWWNSAKDQVAETKVRLQRRAAHWYRLALTDLTGLTKAKVNQRLAAIPKRPKKNSSDPDTKKPEQVKPKRKQKPSANTHPVLGYEMKRHPQGALPFNRHWYFVFDRNTTWEDAQLRCQKMGGYLACLETSAEIHFIARLSKGRSNLWVGGVKREDGVWGWVNGQPMKTTNWHPNEPTGDGNRLELTGSGNWNDLGSSARQNTPTSPNRGFVCEWAF
jgi:hypothetical protein